MLLFFYYYNFISWIITILSVFGLKPGSLRSAVWLSWKCKEYYL